MIERYCDLFLLMVTSCNCSIAQSCPTLWYPMDCSMPDFPILHYLPEFTQTQVLIISSISVFSNGSTVFIREPVYLKFSFSISPSSEYSGLISFRADLLFKGLSRVLSTITIQRHQFFSAQPSLWSTSHIHT